MKFTFWAIIAPLLLLIVTAVMHGPIKQHEQPPALAIIAVLWLLVGLARCKIYWRARTRARAWHDEYRR